MTVNPIISIIIPIYNAELYLNRCIDSVIGQSLVDWELILVDDGSHDKSPEICDEYASKDKRIKVIHKQNEGVHKARIEAINVSNGQFLCFVDADDYLMPDALYILYKKAKEGYDIVKGRNIRFNDSCSFVEEPGNYVVLSNREDYTENVIKYRIPPYLWGGLYKKNLFTVEVLNVVPPIPIGEDWLMNLSLGLTVEKYVHIDDIVYAYYINPRSVMQSKVFSHRYVDSIGLQLFSIIGSVSKLKHIVSLNRIAAHIKCFFTPELPWDENQYQKVITFLNTGNNEKEIRTMMDVRFLKFIHYKPLYRIYRTLYNFLFLYLRLHGHKRKVI